MEHLFFRCPCCGSLAALLREGEGCLCCCGRPMTVLLSKTGPEGGEPAETHLPRVRLQGDTVTVEVGTQPHPSLPEHRILWILLQTRYGGQYRLLPPAGPPRAVFRLEGDFPVAAYAFCSRDGLWRAEV